MEEKDYTIIIYTEDVTGMLLRVSTVFTKRKLNIVSITASPSEVEGIHRYTIVFKAGQHLAEIVAKQLEKQIDVIKAIIYNDEDIVYQEIALYKVPTQALHESENIEKIVRDHHARILNFTADFVIIEKTGHHEDTQELYEELAPYGLMEFVRSGSVAISKPTAMLSTQLKELQKNFSHTKQSFTNN
jgi:acetolactate synthase I/III small subunit